MDWDFPVKSSNLIPMASINSPAETLHLQVAEGFRTCTRTPEQASHAKERQDFEEAMRLMKASKDSAKPLFSLEAWGLEKGLC